MHMHMGIFVNQEKIHPTQFSLHFGGLGEKTYVPHHLFFFILTQPNTLQKSFTFHFLSKVFHPHYFTKQIHPLCMGRCQFNYKALDPVYISSSKCFFPLVLTLFLFLSSKNKNKKHTCDHTLEASPPTLISFNPFVIFTTYLMPR